MAQKLTTRVHKALTRRRVDIEGWEHKAFISVPVAAAVLDFGMTKTWEMVYAGTIPSVKVGANRKVSVAGLKAYVRQIDEASGGEAA